MEKRICAFEMWIFRRIGRVSWTEKTTNKDVCGKLKVTPQLLATIKARKLIYFGHIVRHRNIQHEILTGRIEGSRGRGRPRRTWNDNIKEWTGRPWNECYRKAQDRKLWRAMARRPLEQR